TFTYDSLDRLTAETTPAGRVSYAYDAAGRRTAMTVAGQPQVAYVYDRADQLIKIAQGTLSAATTYDAARRPSATLLPNGVKEAYAYDASSQLTGLSYTRGSATLGTLSYGYDAAGRVASMGGTMARTGIPQPVASATYDAANRLTRWGSATLTYD